MNISSKIRFLKIVQNVQKMAYQLKCKTGYKSTTFDTGISMKHSNLVLICSLCFYLSEKIKTNLILINTKSQSLFQAGSSINLSKTSGSPLNSTGAKLTIHVLTVADQT